MGRLWVCQGRAGHFLCGFGDILIHEPIYRYGLSQGDFSFLFENQKDRLKEYDVTVINQETPFVKDPSAYSDYPRFGTPVEVEKAIKEAGFDVVTCATNHALDQGAEGVNVTKTLLQEDGITCLGIQKADEKEYRPYELLKRKGVCFALLIIPTEPMGSDCRRMRPTWCTCFLRKIRSGLIWKSPQRGRCRYRICTLGNGRKQRDRCLSGKVGRDLSGKRRGCSGRHSSPCIAAL